MKTEKKKGFAALDAVLLLLLLTVTVCLGVRIFLGEDGLFSGNAKAPGTYTVSVLAKSSSPTLGNLLVPGHNVFLTSGEILGEVATVYEKSADITVSGIMTDSGFMLNGNIYLAPNMDIKVQSDDRSATVTVTDISYIGNSAG